MKTINEIHEIRQEQAADLLVRLSPASLDPNSEYKRHIIVCGGSACTSTGCQDIFDKVEAQMTDAGLMDKIKLIKSGCFGLCAAGPVVLVFPEGAFYAQVKLDDVDRIIEKHFIEGEIQRDLLFPESRGEEDSIIPFEETNFYGKQKRIALRNGGMIDPENINEYIGIGGYEALEKALKMDPQEVIDEIKASNIRGRGGGGFPTGMKWQFVAGYGERGDKFVACNADEGDPGAFMDRAILEADPHAIIEAMTIAAHAVGANKGYVYVRAEYPLAIHRLEIALQQARDYGLLGKNILGSELSFDITLKLGAGAFVCGEETALLNSIEGYRGEPRVRPPFPAEKGLWEKPTLLNNVETYANIPQIIMNGGEWYKNLGSEGNAGTKVFALSGKINNVGLVEIPMGTTLRTVVEDIGGGIPNKKQFKAAQTGGPSGGCIPAHLLDTPIDYDSLKEIGTMIGSGGLVIMDEDTCMVDVAKFFLEFTVDESCGKCTPCRIGTKRMHEMLTKITEGKATLEDLDTLEELCYTIKGNSLCGLGQTAPNPVLSTLHYFREEYEAHITDGKCPAGVCKGLVTYTINDRCIGCTKCARVCPVGCISGELKSKHEIDQAKCIKCGLCYSSCPVKPIKAIDR